MTASPFPSLVSPSSSGSWEEWLHVLKAVLVTGEIVGWGRGFSLQRLYGGIEQRFEGRGESEEWIIGFKLTDKNKIVCMIS